jgi:hypothetical protein
VNDAHIDIEAFAGGRLDPDAAARAAAHVAACAACDAEVTAYERLQQAIAAQAVPDPGAHYWQEFAARVEARLQPGAAPGLYDRLFTWLLPGGRWAILRAAAAVAAACALVYIGMRGYRPVEWTPREIASPPDASPPGAVPVAPAPAGPPVQETAPVAPPVEAPAPRGTPQFVPPPPARREAAPEPTAALDAAPERAARALRQESVAAEAAPGAGNLPHATLAFVIAATAGDTVLARAHAARARDPDVDAALATWLAPPSGQTPPAAKAQAGATSAGVPLDAWLAFESLAWPHRAEPAAQAPLSAIARALAQQAHHDARAAERARAVATYLRDTAGDAAQRSQWESLLHTLP